MLLNTITFKMELNYISIIFFSKLTSSHLAFKGKMQKKHKKLVYLGFINLRTE